MTTVDRDEHTRSAHLGSDAPELVTIHYTRSPRDLIRLVGYLVNGILLVALTIWLEDSVLGFEQDVIRVFDFVTPAVARVLHGSLEWATLLLTAGVYLVPLFTRRYRLFAYVATAGLGAFAVIHLVLWLIERQHISAINKIAERAGITASTTSGVVGFALLAAEFVVIGPFVSARWRHAGVATLGLLVAVRFLIAFHLPGNVLIAVPIGAAVGAAVLLTFGRPERRPTPSAIRLALVDAGLPVEEVRDAKVDARGSTPYVATFDDGSGLFVKVLGEEERAADVLFRTYRFLRLKDVGDDRPFLSLRRAVEHEALVSLVARDVGVRTPRMRGVVSVDLDSMMLAYDRIDGRPVDAMDDAEVTDELMRGAFEQLLPMRTHRIAHRDLRRANIFVSTQGEAWIIDFGFGELAADRGLLDADVAHLLASFAVVTGPERPVRAAIEVLGRDAVADALPRLQLQALSGTTQTALKAQDDLLRDLQHEVQTQASVDEVRFAELERVNKKMLLTLIIVAATTYFLLPQFADLPGIVQQVKRANWWWSPLIVVMSAATFIGAAAAMAGGVPNRLRTAPLVGCQVAAAFASKLAPAGIGGMALNVRYLQKQGVDRPVAVSGVGLSTVAGLLVHVSLIGVFILWAGRNAFGSFKLPDPKWFVIGAAVAIALAAIGLAIPFTRRFFTEGLLPVLRRSFDGLAAVARQPLKMLALFAGSALTTLGNLLALYFSLAAFGGGLPFATVGAVYLIGATVASAAPTPGGLGAMEAALISSFVAAGLPSDTAVPAVFLYRLATFWLPVLPGWISLTWLQRRDYI